MSVAGLPTNAAFTLNFEQVIELTRLLVAQVKTMIPNARTLITITHPFGEYHARGRDQRAADALRRNGRPGRHQLRSIWAGDWKWACPRRACSRATCFSSAACSTNSPRWAGRSSSRPSAPRACDARSRATSPKDARPMPRRTLAPPVGPAAAGRVDGSGLSARPQQAVRREHRVGEPGGHAPASCRPAG